MLTADGIRVYDNGGTSDENRPKETLEGAARSNKDGVI